MSDRRNHVSGNERRIRAALGDQLVRVDELIDAYPLDYGTSANDALDDDSTMLGALVSAVRRLADLNAALRHLVDTGDASSDAALICGATDASVAMLLQLTGELAAINVAAVSAG